MQLNEPFWAAFNDDNYIVCLYDGCHMSGKSKEDVENDLELFKSVISSNPPFKIKRVILTEIN